MTASIIKTATAVGFLLATACSTLSTKNSYSNSEDYLGRPTLKSDMLATEGQPLSPKQVNGLLSAKVDLNRPLKIAVAKLGHSVAQNYYTNVSEEKLYRQYATKANGKAFSELIKKSKRIKDVSFIPQIMMPKGRGLRDLRDVAAVMQADVLLIIYTNTDADFDLNVSKKNEAKAVATLEAIAMDVRTGTVPFTSIATGVVKLNKEKDDFSNEEFRARTVIEAEDKAMTELTNDLAAYFD